jgi:hypothetical protein
MAVGLLALLIAMSGSSYAVVRLGKNSVGSAQLRPGAVQTSDVKDGAVTPAKLAKGTLASGTPARVVADHVSYAERAGLATRTDTADRAGTAASASRATAAGSAPYATRASAVTDTPRLGGKDALDFLPRGLIVDVPRFSLTDGQERQVLDLGALDVTARCDLNRVTSSGIVDRADMIVGTTEAPGVLDGLHALTADLKPDSPEDDRILIEASAPAGTPGFAASADGTFGAPDGTEVRSAVVHAGVNVFGEPDRCFFGGFFLV